MAKVRCTVGYKIFPAALGCGVDPELSKGPLKDSLDNRRQTVIRGGFSYLSRLLAKRLATAFDLNKG